MLVRVNVHDENGGYTLSSGYCAEQVVGEGILKYVKRTFAMTRPEAINQMLEEIQSGCRTCEGKRYIYVANGPDDFEKVHCPDCGLEVDDFSGATTDKR